MGPECEEFVSRGGKKLAAALNAFGLDVGGKVCADFGCNVGGFADCLLRRGAAKVYAVDTGYGELAWRLRKDTRVVVMERTNALYCAPPEPVDLVTIDVAWTPQELIIPAAAGWLKGPAGASNAGVIVSLLKPHYELAKKLKTAPPGRLSADQAAGICLEVCRRLGELGCDIRAAMRSTLLGKGGNEEFFLLLVAAGVAGE
ncbi:MAG: TlyA family rRNA (cytidine-2'-O)-methyltransferase [Phycisphaerae bacterium]|nr:TlyA family rRNA (cytidine-2'-O)-methyltransferase [Phycisphaerae bacterium]